MFDHLDQQQWRWSADDRLLADAMAGYWTNFVKSGDPNEKGLPTWPLFQDAAGPLLNLGVPIAPGEVPGRDALKVFDEVYGQVRAPASR